MSPGAPSYRWRLNERDDGRGAAWATAVAIMFAAVAALSFAVEQSVTLTRLPAPPPSVGTSR